MKSRILFAVVALIVCVMSLAVAQEKRAFTVEDLWKVKRVSAPVMSPDGKWLAVTVSTYDMEENKGATDIWLLATDGSERIQLTAHPANDSSPKWASDSKHLAFISNRGENGSQIYAINVYGGEARVVTDIPTGASSLQWSPDDSKIYFISSIWPDCEDDECLKKKLDERKKSKVKAHVTDRSLFRFWNRYLTDGRVPTLFVHDLESGEHRNIMKDSGVKFDPRGGSYAVSPDGKEIALVINNVENPSLDSNNDIFVMPAEGGAARNITADNKGSDGGPKYSPDGKYIAYTTNSDPIMVPGYNRLALIERASGNKRVLTEGFESSPGSINWAADGSRLFFTAGVKARAPVFAVSVNGGEVEQLFMGHTMSGLQVSPDGKRFYVSRQAFSLPPTIFASDPDGRNRLQLSHFNDELLADIAWHDVEVHTFKGADGDDVEMFVLKPQGFDPSKKYPLVHLLHGGPHGAWMDSFHIRWNAQLFAAPGYVVTAMNFHGSSTFGQKFFDSIHGREADKPYTDTMAATDYMLSLGYIDESRMAAGGGSYGGYLANWVATQTDRFATLFTHAGGFNHWGMWASDTPRFRQRRWGGFPWEAEKNVMEQSPNVYAENIKTPMLVLHGEIDYRVVVTQGIELYNTLQILGVPSKLIIFPDEGHWIAKPQNARLWWNEVHAWLGKYIGGE